MTSTPLTTQPRPSTCIMIGPFWAPIGQPGRTIKSVFKDTTPVALARPASDPTFPSADGGVDCGIAAPAPALIHHAYVKLADTWMQVTPSDFHDPDDDMPPMADDDILPAHCYGPLSDAPWFPQVPQ